MAKLPPGIRERQGRFQVRYYGTDGREHSKTFRRLTDAKQFQAAMVTKKATGEWTDPRGAKVPFDIWAQRYLEHKAVRIRPRTAEKYEASVRDHLVPAFGHTAIGALSHGQIQAWVNSMYAEGFAPETIRGHYALLAAMLKRAAATGVLARTPAYDIELPRPVKTEQRYLDEQQVDALADEVPEQYRTLIYAASYLGLRWQELAGLRRTMVDLRPGKLATVRIVTTIERARGRYQPVDYGKSAAARRTLKMPEFLRDVFAWHLGAFKNDEWVFAGAGGGYLLYGNVRSRIWAPAVERAGLAPLKFHELRHTAAAFMIDDGADPLQVKRRMGHEDIRTTFNLYGHLFDDREDELVAALDRRKNKADADKMRTSSDAEVVAIDTKRAEKSL